MVQRKVGCLETGPEGWSFKGSGGSEGNVEEERTLGS